VKTDIAPAVTLQRQGENRVRAHVHAVVDIAGQMDAEERVPRVGNRIHHALDPMPGRRAELVVLPAEGNDPHVGQAAQLTGEMIAGQTRADDQLIEGPCIGVRPDRHAAGVLPDRADRRVQPHLAAGRRDRQDQGLAHADKVDRRGVR
jgi:hypothetical protein